MPKTCNKCGVPKPLSQFHKDRQQKDGRSGACKDCRSEIQRVRYHRNRERAAALNGIDPILPKPGQKFRAFVRSSGREHVCSPFTCDTITHKEYYPAKVYAGDWRLSAGAFYFVLQ